MGHKDSERSLLVLYGSQTGCAQEVAERIAWEGKRRLFRVRLAGYFERERLSPSFYAFHAHLSIVQRGVSVCSLVRPTAILKPRPNCLSMLQPSIFSLHHTFAESARADLSYTSRGLRRESLANCQLVAKFLNHA